MPANRLDINTTPLALPPARVTAAAPRKHSGQIKSPLSRQLGPLQGVNLGQDFQFKLRFALLEPSCLDFKRSSRFYVTMEFKGANR